MEKKVANNFQGLMSVTDNVIMDTDKIIMCERKRSDTPQPSLFLYVLENLLRYQKFVIIFFLISMLTRIYS